MQGRLRLATALVASALLAAEAVGAATQGYTAAWMSPPGGSRQGLSLTALGNAVLVGAPDDYGFGSATVCDGRTGLPVISLPSVIAGSDSGGMGFAVAASERGLLVSVPGNDEVLRFDTRTGEPRMAYVAPKVDPTGFFGFSVVWVGKNVLIGDPTEGSDRPLVPGVAYLYDGDTGVLLRRIESPAPVPGGGFGSTIARWGSGFAIGAPGYPFTSGGPPPYQDGWGPGAVFVFDRNGDPIVTLTAPQPARLDRFGSALAAWRTRLLVGAPGTAPAAYIFSTTHPTISLGPPEPGTSEFGTAVALAHRVALVGDPYNSTVLVLDPISARPLGTLTLPAETDDGRYFSGLGSGVAIVNRTLVAAGRDEFGAILAGFVAARPPGD